MQPINKLQMERMFQKGRWDQLFRTFNSRTEVVYNMATMLMSTAVPGALVSDYENAAGIDMKRGESPPVINENITEKYPEMRIALRLAVGLSLYLKSLPRSSSHVSKWHPIRLPRTMSTQSITAEAEVCDVTSIYKFTADEQRTLDAIKKGNRPHGFEIRTHFREGHWRRAPGTGSDPTAPKTVHVRPTLVRRDLLSEGELPSGAVKKM